MHVCVCVCLFVYVYVSGWVLDSTSIGTSPPPYSLPVAGAPTCWCTDGSRCPGLGARVRTGSFPAAALVLGSDDNDSRQKL